MRLLLDENVDHRLIKPLLKAGHDVKVAEKGTRNSALFLLAKKEQRILLTNDKGFLKYTPEKSMGIIVFRVFPDTFENQKSAVLRMLSKFKKSKFFGKVLIVGRDWKA